MKDITVLSGSDKPLLKRFQEDYAESVKYPEEFWAKVAETAVIGKPDKLKGERIKAFIVLCGQAEQSQH